MKKLFLIIAVIVVSTVTVNVNGQKHLKKLMNAEFAISQFYVDSVSEDKLVEDAIKGMLEQLDPHSSYSTAEETRELEEPLEGEFSGIGIQFNMLQDTLYVIQTIAGGPAEKVGMVAGDRIIQVEDSVIAGVKMRNTKIMKMLRGKKGSKVNVLVKRHGVAEPIPFRITRDDIPLYSIDATYMADKNTGYVKVSRFGKKTDEEFNDAIAELKKQGMKQLIIDLTNNGGGYLQTAVELANNFLERGNGIVYTQGVNSSRYEANANGRGKMSGADFKIVVMVDQYSASASEIAVAMPSDAKVYSHALKRYVYLNNGVQYVVATGEESYRQLAKEYNLFTKELLRFNDLSSSKDKIAAGTIVYIEKKKNRNKAGVYTVSEGDTPYSVSQKTGIRLKSLCKMNGLAKGSELYPGTTLKLKK